MRRLRLAWLTVLPNLFPVLVVLGFMGWAGIAFDTATASIAAIVLGLSVDDTVHFVHHYQRQRRHLGPAAARRANCLLHDYLRYRLETLLDLQIMRRKVE